MLVAHDRNIADLQEMLSPLKIFLILLRNNHASGFGIILWGLLKITYLERLVILTPQPDCKLVERRKSMNSVFDACADGRLVGAWCLCNEGPCHQDTGNLDPGLTLRIKASGRERRDAEHTLSPRGITSSGSISKLCSASGEESRLASST